MELEPRTAVPAHATGAVEFVKLSAVSLDATFRLRDEGDVSELAASIGRLGQLAPVELRWRPDAADGEPRYQMICGFRRLAALRLLARERVLARVHGTLDDEDAWAMAFADALLREPLLASEIDALRERLSDGRIAPWARELLDAAIARAPLDPAVRERIDEPIASEPGTEGESGAAEDPVHDETVQDETVEGETVEVTPEEFAEELARNMFEVNQDLALALESWGDLPADGRLKILEQARWVAMAFLPLLEERKE